MKRIYLTIILICSYFFSFSHHEAQLFGDWFLHYRTNNGVVVYPPFTVEENYVIILNFSLLPPNAGNPFTVESYGPTTTTFEGRFNVDGGPVDSGTMMLFNIEETVVDCDHPQEVCDYFEAYNNAILFDSNTVNSDAEYVATYTITGPDGNETLTLTNNATGDFAVYGKQVLSNPSFIQQFITAHPNPTKDILNISNNRLNTTYSIYSIDGKIIANKNLLKESIDVSHLKTGIYFLEIGNNEVVKFVKN